MPSARRAQVELASLHPSQLPVLTDPPLAGASAVHPASQVWNIRVRVGPAVQLPGAPVSASEAAIAAMRASASGAGIFS